MEKMKKHFSSKKAGFSKTLATGLAISALSVGLFLTPTTVHGWGMQMGGMNNQAKGDWSGTFVGSDNVIDVNGEYSAIVAAKESVVDGEYSTIVSAEKSILDAEYSAIVAGSNNEITTGAKGSVILGGNANNISGANSVIIAGENSSVTASNSVAFGNNSTVSVDGTLALGSNSNANVEKGKAGFDVATNAASTETSGAWVATENALAVGTVDGTNTRQIIGLAAGTEDTDAVNVAQLKSAFSNVVSKEYVDNSVGAITNTINNSLEEVRGEMSGIGAHSAALAALKPLQYRPNEKTQIMAGVGRYKNANSFALGLAVHSNEDLLLNGGIAFGSGQTMMMNAGVTWRVGTKAVQEAPSVLQNGPISAMNAVVEEVVSLRADKEALEDVVSIQSEKIEHQDQEIAELKAQMKEVLARLAN